MLCNIILILLILLIIIVIYFYNKNKYENFKIIENIDSNIDLVIVSSHYNEDIEWLKETDLPVVVCSKVLNSPLCSMNINKGREASSYLKFIIDNYDILPKNIAFIHGHEDAWHHNLQHQNSKTLIDIIKCAKYKAYGYISLNNLYIDDRNINNENYVYMQKELWNLLFRPYLNRNIPNHILHDCCAQFIVSRERILNLPKEAYEKWYNYILYEDPLDDNSFKLGIIFEYLWHIIFGEPDIVTKQENLKRFSCNLI